MEQGSLRCDVNTSLNRPGEEWGTRTETKNVNSLRSVERAVRLGDHPPGRACSTRGRRCIRRRGTSPRRPATPGPAAARRRPPTTGTSPSLTSCRSRRTRRGSSRSGLSLPELPAARRARLSESARRLAPTTCARWPTRAWSISSAPPSTPARRSARRVTGGSATWPSGPTSARSTPAISASRRLRSPG